jgi:hypothetical protein
VGPETKELINKSSNSTLVIKEATVYERDYLQDKGFHKGVILGAESCKLRVCSEELGLR